MSRRGLGVQAGLGVASGTGKPCYVIERPADAKWWRVVECHPDGTTVVVEDGLRSQDKAASARNRHDLRRQGL